MPPHRRVGDLDVTDDLVSVIYHCHACKGKATFGKDFFLEQNKVPDKCPNCETPYVQSDRVLRNDADTEDDIRIKVETVKARRGEAIPVREKPQDPEEIKRMRIKHLRDEATRLENGEPERGVRLV